MSFDPSDRDTIVENLVPLVRGEPGGGWQRGILCGQRTSPSPATFYFYEHWATEEAFDRHCQTPHYLSFSETCMPRIKGVSASRHEISDSKSLV